MSSLMNLFFKTETVKLETLKLQSHNLILAKPQLLSLLVTLFAPLIALVTLTSHGDAQWIEMQDISRPIVENEPFDLLFLHCCVCLNLRWRRIR